MSKQEELTVLIERRQDVRDKEATLTQEIKQMRTQISKDGNKDSFEDKYRKFKSDAAKERSEKIMMRLRLHKALKMLGFKNKEIAKICGISKNSTATQSRSLKRKQYWFGEWLNEKKY